MKLIIDIDDNDYELLNKTGITLDWNTAFHGKEKDREMTFALFNLVKALKDGTIYHPQGDLISRDALKEEVNKKEVVGRFNTLLLIDNAPTVDAVVNTIEVRPQGEWIDHSEDGYVECPFCEHLTNCEDNIDELHYCWNCGAKNTGRNNK